MICGTK